jgi:predicted amidophosphoribosyltransferase
MRDTWRTVWNFKNDPDKNVSAYEHQSALETVTDLVENTLRSAFGSKTEYLTLVCLTASTQRKTELRYKDFAEQVCKDLNMHNAYPHIQVIEGGSAKHDGGDGSRRVSYDRYFFNGKYIVLFDDVRTTGHSLEQERRTMEELGAKVICAVTIAQTSY